MPVNPADLKIVTHPAAVLRKKAAPVPTPIIDEVRRVAERMIELMHKAPGIGLAAPQIGLSWRLFVVDIPVQVEEDEEEVASVPVDPSGLPTTTDGPEVYINPVISAPQGGSVVHEEGCLSLPDIRGDVLRPPTVTISALDQQGNAFTKTATGLLARCWQHELDHLDGVLIIDRFTQMSRLKNRSALRDLERS